MDSNLIYVKTVSGEEAMRQRTRVVQRNMRMVLILVDGKATVADLCEKTANAQMTESALRDLEQGGFIEPILDRDSVWEQSKKVAQEIKAAALGHSTIAPSPEKVMAEVPVEAPSHNVQPETLRNVSDSSLSLLPEVSAYVVEPARLDPFSTFGVERVLNLPQATPVVKQVKQASLLERLSALLPAKKPKEADDDFSIKPIRRGGDNHPMSWWAIVALSVLGLGVTLFLVTVFFPYTSYLPDVEAQLASVSGQPAKVAEMRVSFYPKPGLYLSNIRLGNTGDAKEIRISEMRLMPMLGTVLATRKVFREVVLRGVTLPAESLLSLSSAFNAAAQPSSRAGVLSVLLENADISFRGLVLAEMNGEIKLASDGSFASLELDSPNRSLHLQAKPAAIGVDIGVEAYAWRSSQESMFIFDSASVKGNLNGSALSFSKMELRIFDGVVKGVAVLGLANKPTMAGDISFDRISAKRFGEALGIGLQFEGETTGKLKFTAAADSWPLIFSGIDAEGDFIIHRGVLGAIDLAEAVRRASAAPTQGGITRFESLSGRLKLAADGYRFSGLALSSGLMQSVGQIVVSKNLQVSGNMDVQMRGTANKLNMSLSISGPLKAPVLQAGKR